ncbi:hypothetical protein R3W88_000558 [Solanum pinnatisectum]|uniref:Polyprotein protein n=1 Tax=Solanum pinnatisectum TaxID=50273 RepID=A0AAV9MG94_9SOLN|nr:hypothetical protein R3W88_000558 [Solanum pinnatisectum]
MREHRGLINAHKLALDAFTVRVEAYEQSWGASDILTALKVDIIRLRNHMDELKSTNLSMLFGTVEIPDVPSVDVPTSSDVHPAATIGDVDRDYATDESKADTDEEELGVRDATMYDDPEDLEGSMVQKTIEASLRDSEMVGSSRANDDVAPDTNTQDNGVT